MTLSITPVKNQNFVNFKSNSKNNNSEEVKQNSEQYKTNTSSNKFLKEYIERKAGAKGVQIPDNVKICISSPEQFSDKYKKLLHDVRLDVYGARVGDMFALLEKDSNAVKERVNQMNIPQQDKDKVIELKQLFDDYYKIEMEYKGKKVNLLDLDDDTKKQLQEESPKFLEFINNEQEDLKKQKTIFSKEEIKAVELSEAGMTSRYAAGVLTTVLLFNVAKGIWDSKQVKKEMQEAEALIKYLKENKEEGEKLLEEGGKILADYEEKLEKATKEELQELKKNNPVEKFLKSKGFDGGEIIIKQKNIYSEGIPKFVNPLKAFKKAKWAAFLSLMWITLAGSLDDCLGAVKDFFQDQNNFGAKTAAAIAFPSVAAGILSSAFIAPTVESHIDYKRATNSLQKIGLIEQLKGSAKLKHFGKMALISAPLGMVIASASSGSSWMSMLLTRIKMAMNGDKLEKKNIIDKKDNTFKNTNENMFAYEAYKGKWSGITKGDWSIGAVGGGLGLFTHTNPYIQSLSFGLQGCSETLTACFYQLFGNKARESKIDKMKKELVNSVAPNSNT